MLLHQYGEGLFRFFLRRKVLDDADTRDVLMNECIQIGGFLRKIRQRLWEKSWITVSPTINTGRVERLASARRGLFTSIITTTLATVIKSGIRVVTLLFSTSFKELISPMIRERIFPVGRLSKSENPVSGYGCKVPDGWLKAPGCTPSP